ncbi:MAG TPA: hypothetical protein VF771_03240 [Longimicrobiaceae bacterium]
MRLLAALLLLALPFLEAPAQRRAPSRPIPYRMVRNRVSGAMMPRLLLPTPQARAVNARLDTLYSGFRCTAREMRTPGAEPFRHRARVTYAAGDVFSVDIVASWFCGNVHPENDANLSVTYDLRTGEMVPFSALFADYRRDGREIVRLLFPRQAALSMRPAPSQPDVENECEGLIPLADLPMRVEGYSLSPRGLTAELRYPHAFQECGAKVTVPYARVRRFAAPRGILARVAGARR